MRSEENKNPEEEIICLFINLKNNKEALGQIKDLIANKAVGFHHIPSHATAYDTSGHHPLSGKLLFVWNKCGFVKILEEEIVFLEASRSYCIIHLCNKNPLVVSIPMSEVRKHLSETKFIRIHRTYTVNTKHIESLTGNMINLSNGENVTIGREYQKATFSCFTFIGSKNRKYNH